MADFFSDFSFEEAMRQPSSIREAERAMNVSPTQIPITPMPTRLPTPPPCTIGDLAHRFNQQTLRIDSSAQLPSFFSLEPLTPPSDDFAFSTRFSRSSSPSEYACMSAAEIRLQRQAHTRMQCNPSHVKDIDSLVERMIFEGDQCRICEHKSRTSSTTSTVSSSSSIDDDEGVDMDYTPPSPSTVPAHLLKFRRSGDRVVGHAAVSKNVRMRMRKSPKMLRRPSSK